MQRVIDKTVESFGRLDVVFANAGTRGNRKPRDVTTACALTAHGDEAA